MSKEFEAGIEEVGRLIQWSAEAGVPCRLTADECQEVMSFLENNADYIAYLEADRDELVDQVEVLWGLLNESEEK